MISDQLKSSEYHKFYQNYIDSATSEVIVEGLIQNLETVVSFYSRIPAAKHDYAYAEGKWTVKDILLHVIDTERIFAYRALRIARQDRTPLAGFEQDEYIVPANAKQRSMERLLDEYKSVRQATISLFQSFDSSVLMQIGKASGFSISVKAIGYILTGHENHHIKIIKTRYLNCE